MLDKIPSQEEAQKEASANANTIFLFQEDGKLRAFWYFSSYVKAACKNYFKTASIQINTDNELESLLQKGLPNPGETSKDEILINKIASKYNCSKLYVADIINKLPFSSTSTIDARWVPLDPLRNREFKNLFQEIRDKKAHIVVEILDQMLGFERMLNGECIMALTKEKHAYGIYERHYELIERNKQLEEINKQAKAEKAEGKAQREQAEAKAAEEKAQREQAEAKAAEEKAQREQAEAKAAEEKAQREQAEAKAAEAEAEIVRLRKEIEDLKLAPSKKDAQVRQEADNVADDTPPPIVGLPTAATDRSQVGLLNRQGIFSTTSPRPSQQPALPHPANDDIGSHPTGLVQCLVPKNK